MTEHRDEDRVAAIAERVQDFDDLVHEFWRSAGDEGFDLLAYADSLVIAAESLRELVRRQQG